ncbi:hypothetical protein ruthe_03107 [Rubellimicrobium thermophilum DSM 16684]|uniref:Uncharacterized protein n=1 Tax=Rubellimicrobium thermophilum DSM 16684 TaxID=1123069 RepID=S9QTC2_9RHOB|nr:hypothetical protein [Rubellimicrobium thermophilum]EPX82882.1 hypothetical protein ruthe_03107 [Rubellimicrobium thermophilum DSM 16684]
MMDRPESGAGRSRRAEARAAARAEARAGMRGPGGSGLQDFVTAGSRSVTEHLVDGPDEIAPTDGAPAGRPARRPAAR